MSGQTLTVNRKKYAVGLFWQPVGAGFIARNYARNLARNIDKKLNLFVEYHSMVGLGGYKLGQRAGQVSAAAEVMESFSEYTSFLAMFHVGVRYYLVAARNGIILQDKIFDSEQAARKEYSKLAAIPDWGAFFAPGAWGVPRAAERNLADVLRGRSHAVLRSISWLGVGATSMLLVALFLLCVGMIFSDSLVRVFSSRPNVAQLNPELVAEYKRQIEESNKKLDQEFDIQKPLPPEPIVMPYEFLPNVEARAEQCYQAIGFMMQQIPGWNQVDVVCGEEYVVANFKRSFGSFADFYSVATELMPGVLVQEIGEDAIRVRAKLPALEVGPSQDERDPDTIVRDITSVFQSVDMPVETAVVVDTLTNGVDTETVNVVEVGAESKLVPMQFMKIFEEFDGVYMMQVSWDVRSRSWNYEVVVYAK